MPIIDSHCHAWAAWPYLPDVPDPVSKGAVGKLLNEMTLNGVDRATIVSAQIFGNFDNNDYVARAVRENPGRLEQFADVDSFWSETYHTPGAARRLEAVIERWPIKGFTHYVAKDDDGEWFNSREGRDFLGVASEARLIASLAIAPRHQKALRQAAARHPDLAILCHHMSGMRADEPEPRPLWREVMASADLPNIFLKLSGFHYVTDQSRIWDYPYRDTRWVYESAYERFGTRMCWGSDYPVVTKAMTYRQSLEAFRTHCDFVPEQDRAAILGGTLEGLLARSGSPA